MLPGALVGERLGADNGAVSSRPRPPDDDDDDAAMTPRRPSERAQLRAALALEEAGELQEAARLFEYVGEHAQAASLRLEHADTLRDEQQRLAVLREGCARNPATSEQGQALHRALGEALLRVAEGLDGGARKRALVLEAAQALEAGQRGGEAGRLYEGLSLLSRAARAYADAGEIDRLEAVHQALDERERVERAMLALEREVETAIAQGRRLFALELLRAQQREQSRTQRAPRPALAAAQAELERRSLRELGFGLVLRERDTTSRVHVVARTRLRLGRGPHCELVVEGAALSREHAELALHEGEIVVRDLGSRAGTFLDGRALAPGDDVVLEPEAGLQELALGIAAAFELLRIPAAPRPSALLRPRGPARAWTLFLPRGGLLWSAPERVWPIALELVDDHVRLSVASDTQIVLSGEPLGAGAAIELLVHDRLRIEPPRGPAFELEITAD
jgi:hypothetical protein